MEIEQKNLQSSFSSNSVVHLLYLFLLALIMQAIPISRVVSFCVFYVLCVFYVYLCILCSVYCMKKNSFKFFVQQNSQNTYYFIINFSPNIIINEFFYNH